MKHVSLFKKSEINTYRTFKSEKEKSNYIALLDAELLSINNMHLDTAAKKIYDLKHNFPDNPISKRCIDFKQMEIFANSYTEG